MMQRMTVYFPDELMEQVHASSKELGQTFSLWMLRAAEERLHGMAIAEKDLQMRAAQRDFQNRPRRNGEK